MFFGYLISVCLADGGSRVCLTLPIPLPPSLASPAAIPFAVDAYNPKNKSENKITAGKGIRTAQLLHTTQMH